MSTTLGLLVAEVRLERIAAKLHGVVLYLCLIVLVFGVAEHNDNPFLAVAGPIPLPTTKRQSEEPTPKAVIAARNRVHQMFALPVIGSNIVLYQPLLSNLQVRKNY